SPVPPTPALPHKGGGRLLATLPHEGEGEKAGLPSQPKLRPYPHRPPPLPPDLARAAAPGLAPFACAALASSCFSSRCARTSAPFSISIRASAPEANLGHFVSPSPLGSPLAAKLTQ